MATITIAHKPELTAERAMEAFERHFAGKYQVYKTRIWNRHFIVKKSGWTGVGVRVKQEEKGTTLVFSAMMPNLLLQGMFGGLIAYAFLR